MKRCLGYSLF